MTRTLISAIVFAATVGFSTNANASLIQYRCYIEGNTQSGFADSSQLNQLKSECSALGGRLTYKEMPTR